MRDRICFPKIHIGRPVSAAILRSVERGRHVALSLQANGGATLPFQTILDNSIAFVEDAMLVTRGPGIRFQCRVDSGPRGPH